MTLAICPLRAHLTHDTWAFCHQVIIPTGAKYSPVIVFCSPNRFQWACRVSLRGNTLCVPWLLWLLLLLQRPPGGYKITVYHTMHDEVNNYRTHVWRCISW